MLKKSLVALAAVLGGAAAMPALAANALKCEAPVIQVSSVDTGAAQYTVQCQGASDLTITPSVTFSGEVFANGTPPYEVKASYLIDIRDAYSKKLGQDARADQLASGELHSSTVSVASLPSQFASQTDWDPKSSTLSIEEKPGVWRAYPVVLNADTGPSLSDAGVASTPVHNGIATAKLVFDKKYSRFAGKGADVPVVTAQLGLRDGKFEVLIGESRAAAAQNIQAALFRLDTKPSDVTRAWALASAAQFLGLEDEVRYAEQKVAAFHPQWLEEFQQNVERIKPDVFPR
ncbi:hypothetical protein KTD31_03625 [Burkholderia multivorans]|jgi:hypothetical protein|uniref:hypothetical protein n=1 Tax=Burkholderia multivorans TaxID=87883 RepID=UPI001C242DFD|nr:hypothetical protein [Burkholderia multivorans]MBU9200444.1 hypothetical protein [Burkholderia multivorans]